MNNVRPVTLIPFARVLCEVNCFRHEQFPDDDDRGRNQDLPLRRHQPTPLPFIALIPAGNAMRITAPPTSQAIGKSRMASILDNNAKTMTPPMIPARPPDGRPQTAHGG